MTAVLTETKVQLYRFIRIAFADGSVKTFERKMYTGRIVHQYQLDQIVRMHQDKGLTYFNLLARRSMFPGTPPKPIKLVAAWTGLRDSQPQEKDKFNVG